jgi:hypothetical protein
MLDKEGADDPADVALIGTRGEVLERLDGLHDAGATEYMAWVFGGDDEQAATGRVSAGVRAPLSARAWRLHCST